MSALVPVLTFSRFRLSDRSWQNVQRVQISLSQGGLTSSTHTTLLGHTANQHLQKILQPVILTLHESLFLRNVIPAPGFMRSRSVCAKHLALSRSLNTDPIHHHTLHSAIRSLARDHRPRHRISACPPALGEASLLCLICDRIESFP